MPAPALFTSSRKTAFTVAAVPTGMNAGVRIAPRGVTISPSRAPPSAANSLKEKGAVKLSHLPRGEPGKHRHMKKPNAIPREHVLYATGIRESAVQHKEGTLQMKLSTRGPLHGSGNLAYEKGECRRDGTMRPLSCAVFSTLNEVVPTAMTRPPFYGVC
jgi:hypothetical protein